MNGQEPYVSEGPNAVRLPPDEHLMCFDFLYYGGLIHAYEWEEEYFLPWSRVGTHTHFAPRMTALVEEYLMRLFGVETRRDIPPVSPLFTCSLSAPALLTCDLLVHISSHATW